MESLFSVPLLLRHPWIDRLDHMLQARLTFSAYYLQNQPITLLGTRMKDIPNFWVIMDNGFAYILMTFGIAVFILFSVGYMLMIVRFIRQQRLQELAMVFSFLLYGIMEQFISNSFMNLSLIFLGELLFGSCCEQTESDAVITIDQSGLWEELWGKISARKRAIMLTGGISAALSLHLYPQYAEEEYGQLLQFLWDAAAKSLDESTYTWDPVYREQIGKSFGEDRIEHLNSDKTYTVSKSGDIVRVEYGRGAVLAMLAGMAAGILVSSGIAMVRRY